MATATASSKRIGLYPTSGASDDYAFSRHFADNTKTKVYGFTIECGRSFQPTWDEAEDVIREVCAGLIAFCLAAAEYSTRKACSGQKSNAYRRKQRSTRSAP